MANVLLVFLLLLGFGGCASPSLPMLDAPVARLSVEGADFTVRHNAWRAEAVRTSPAAGATVSGNLSRAKTAMERASGCRVRPGTLYGDVVMAEALLDCPGQTGARIQPRWIYAPPPGSGPGV